MKKPFQYRTCLHCRWVHFGVTRRHAENEVKRFNKYFETLSKEKQDEYYGGKGSSIEQYEYCDRCGAFYTQFRESEPNDMPNGSTIGPIIYDVPKKKRVKKA